MATKKQTDPAEYATQEESVKVETEAQPTAEGKELPQLPELDQRMADPAHPHTGEPGTSPGSSEHLFPGITGAQGALQGMAGGKIPALTPEARAAALKAMQTKYAKGAGPDVRMMHLSGIQATAKQINDQMRLNPDRAVDRRMAWECEHGITIVQQVRHRVKELYMIQATGGKLTRAQRNLLDFYNVDLQRLNPPAALDAAMLRHSEGF